jgi:hypothetical protein
VADSLWDVPGTRPGAWPNQSPSRCDLLFRLLRHVPKRFHLRQCRGAGRHAIAFGGQCVLDKAETPFELGVGPADRGLRIGLAMAREIGDAEQKIANFLRDGGRFAGVERRFDFIGFPVLWRKRHKRILLR